MPGRTERKRARGFTLIELMVVVAIMAILTFMSLPVLSPIIRNQAVDSGVSTLQGAIYKCRSLAAGHNSVYTLAFNTSNDFKHILQIYEDSPPTAGNERDKPLILPEGARLRSDTVSNGSYLRFLPTGEVYSTLTATNGVYTVSIIDANGPTDTNDPEYIGRDVSIVKLTGELHKE